VGIEAGGRERLRGPAVGESLLLAAAADFIGVTGLEEDVGPAQDLTGEGSRDGGGDEVLPRTARADPKGVAGGVGGLVRPLLF